MTLAVRVLASKRRWCVTGTPLNNAFEDFDGQFSFFGLSGLDKQFFTGSAEFAGGASRRGRHHDTTHMGVPAACSFLRRVIMRHTKEQKYDSTKLSLLELPKKHIHTLLVPFRKKEEESYKKLEQYISDQYNAIKRAGTNEVSKHMIMLLSLVKDLQLSCSGGRLPGRLMEIINSNPLDVERAAAKAAESYMIRRAGGGAEQEYGECPICLDIMDKPYSTECDHFFCYDCIMGLINSTHIGQTGCPMCRRPVSSRSIKPAPVIIRPQAPVVELPVEEEPVVEVYIYICICEYMDVFVYSYMCIY